MLRTLIVLSHSAWWDVTGLLVWVWKHLADQPSWLAAARAEVVPGAVPGPGSVADHLVSETLRLEQSEYLNLLAEREIRHEGFVIPAGWGVRACVAQNHRDPAVFDDPDSYRPERWAAREYARTEYAPFGMDEHGCLGEHLTRAVARAFVAALAGPAHTWSVVDDGPREMSARQHWAPSSRFRVAVRSRDA